MKEIPVSKRNLIIAVILAVVIAVGILVIENWPLRTEQSSAASTNEDSLGSTVAVNAIEQVFQVNYQEGKEAWLERICEVSTPAGCELFSAGADRMWEKYCGCQICGHSCLSGSRKSSRQWFRASLADDHHAIFSLTG
jgi:hypothetical protein